MIEDTNSTELMNITEPIYFSSTDSHSDNRGEIWTTFTSSTLSININHVKVNTNNPGVFRGFHADPKTTKIASSLKGLILSFVVWPDNSKYEIFELSPVRHSRLIIPKGFYNGFLSLEDSLYIYHLSYSGEYLDHDQQSTLLLEESCVNLEEFYSTLGDLPLIRSQRDAP